MNCTNKLSPLTLVSTLVLVASNGINDQTPHLPSEIFLLTIPSGLGQVSTLQDLFLYDNYLNGTIPSELGQISTLQSLRLEYNALTGKIPSELGPQIS
jgi:hypothetical protein